MTHIFETHCIKVFAPIEKAEHGKEQIFYRKLEEICENVLKRTVIIIIFRDFNARRRKEVADRYRAYNETQENG